MPAAATAPAASSTSRTAAQKTIKREYKCTYCAQAFSRSAPLTVPSTSQNRKRKAPAASFSPMAIDKTRESDHGPLKTKLERANTNVIDLTQSDDTDGSSESSARTQKQTGAIA